MDLSFLDSKVLEVKLHLALKNFPKLGVIARVCKGIEAQWHDLPYIRQKRLQELWKKIVRSEGNEYLSSDEQKDAVYLIVFGAGDECYPLYDKKNICNAILKQIKLSAHAEAINTFALCIWNAWSEDIIKQQTLCNYLSQYANLSPYVVTAMRRGIFDVNFPEESGRACPQDQFVLIEKFLKNKIGIFYERPSFAVINIAWKVALPRYSKLITRALSKNIHTTYSLRDVIHFIEQDSLINGRLRDSSAIREFADAVLSPLKPSAIQNCSTYGDFVVSKDDEASLVDLFEKILGPIQEAHLDLRWERIKQELRDLLKQWDRGRKLNNLFKIASSAWRIVASANSKETLIAWDKRKQFWMRIWAKGYIQESRIFVPRNLCGQLKVQYRVNDIYVVKNSARQSAALVMKLCVDGKKALAIEFNNCGTIRLFDISRHQNLDFTNRTALNVKNDLDFNEEKYPDLAKRITHISQDWESQTKEALRDILGVRI